MRMKVLTLLALFAGVLDCSDATSLASTDGLLPLGNWGGDSAAMIVGDTATHLHISCTYGDVSGRISVRDNGDFDVHGSYLLRAVPIAVGPTMPARFVGHVDGNTATVVVTVTDTVEKKTVVRGPVTITLGRDPKLMPCPICRRPIITHRD
jgi:hypothetical protein